MFVFTNLVDPNVPPGIQMILDPDLLQLFCSIVIDDSREETARVLLTDIEKIILHEPVRGRVFLEGDAIVSGMIFKKIIRKSDKVISEIVCPRNVVVSYYYVPKK